MRFLAISSFALLLFILLALPASQLSSSRVYLGFDRNDYLGDSALPILRRTFSFAGYWLSPPPGEMANSWHGKRQLLQSQGFGFLLLYAGPNSSHLKSATLAARRGSLDARRAPASASSEGFPAGSIIFLDIEEGGRLSPAYHAYLRAWANELMRSDFRPGVYCSGMIVDEGDGHRIITADDIRNLLGSRKISFWVYNDACPPSPGCVFSQTLPLLSASGIPYAAVWQFVRSPRDNETARNCPGYATNGNCYTASDTARWWHLDLDVANSRDPSGTR